MEFFKTGRLDHSSNAMAKAQVADAKQRKPELNFAVVQRERKVVQATKVRAAMEQRFSKLDGAIRLASPRSKV